MTPKISTLKKYTIIFERAKIYKDFVLNLLLYIDKYYLDKETLNKDTDINNHFKFCFNKVVNDFKNENIDFSKNYDLFEYFKSYFYLSYYKTKEINIEKIKKFWHKIFDITNQREKKYINILVESYAIFEKSFLINDF